MILWDYEIREAGGGARLAALPVAHQLSFATATLKHATENRLASVDSAGAGLVSAAIALAWRSIGGDESVDVSSLLASLESSMPDEDEPGEPGVADAIDGAAGLCSCLERPSAKGALSIASYAYQALTCWVLDPTTTMGAEERFVEAERASADCRAEIAFQLSYLAALERLDEGSLPTWEQVAQLMP